MVRNSGQLSQSWECIQTITNYSHSVEQVAFSPDGKTLVSSNGEGDRGCVKLWNVASGEEIHTFSDDHFMAFSQDGQTLVTRNYLWDVATGRAINRVAANFDSHWNIAISPDLQTVASCQRFDQPRVTKLWKTATGKEICTLPRLGTFFMPEMHYRLTQFSPDGQTFAKGVTGVNDYCPEIKLCEVATGREICTIPAKGGGFLCLAFSSNGQILASAWNSQNRSFILLSEVATGKQLCQFKIGDRVFYSLVWSLAFSPDSQILASGETGKITLWRLGRSWLQPLTAKKIRTFSGYSETTRSITFSPDGQTLASGVGYDNHGITLWDVKAGNKIRTFPGHPEAVYHIAISPDGQTVARYKLGYGNLIKLWHTQSGAFIRSLEIGDSIIDVVFSPDGAFLICAGSFRITVWELATGKKIRDIPHRVEYSGCGSNYNILAFSQDGEILAIRDRQKNDAIELLESRTARTMGKINTNLGGVWRVAFSPDRQLLAACGPLPHMLDICSVETGKVIRTVNIHPQEHPGAMVFSPDGQILAIKNENLITLWQVSSGRKIQTIDSDYWDYDEFSLAFSSDGKILASPTRKATIKLWDVATGDEICSLPGHSSSRVNSGASSWIEFSRYGQVLVSGGEDGTIKVWQQK